MTDHYGQREALYAVGMRPAIAQAKKSEDSPAVPYCWMVSGLSRVFRGEYAGFDAKSEAKRCGGDCVAFPLYKWPHPPEA